MAASVLVTSQPASFNGPVSPRPNYLDGLADAAITLLLDYVIRDEEKYYTTVRTIFDPPVFGWLTSGPRWARLLDERARSAYRSQWSSNDYIAFSYLHSDGTIDYTSLLAHIMEEGKYGGGTEVDLTATSWFNAPWVVSFVHGYDIRTEAMHDSVVKQLRAVRTDASVSKETRINCLDRILTFYGLFDVPRPALEAEVLALCERIPAEAARLLLEVEAARFNYPFFMLLHTTFVAPRTGEILNVAQTDLDTVILAAAKKVAVLPHQIVDWRRVWLVSSLRSDDAAIIRATCAAVDLTHTVLSELIVLPQSDEAVGFSLESLCRDDALSVITALELWDCITPRYVAELIIARAPRLRAALQARGYTLSTAVLRGLVLNGLPVHIRSFLAPEVGFDLLDQIASTSAMSAVLLALLQRRDYPLTAAESHRLLTSQRIQSNNLANYVLPVARLAEPTFHALITQFDQEWGVVASPSGSRTLLPPGTGSEWSDYARLYRLFLVYFAEHGTQPRVPFHCYDFRAHEYGSATIGRASRSKDHLLTFAACTYARVCILDEHEDELRAEPTLQTINAGEIIFAYLPAHASVTITRSGELGVYALYDYAVDDFAWLEKAFTARYDNDDE